MFAYVGGITQASAILDAQVAALAPAQTLKRLLERRELGTPCGGRAREHADPAHSLALLLRPRRKRPRRRTAEERDELAAAQHSITSSAATRSLSGTVRPSTRAVWWLMTSSILLDCTTGKSAGLAPLRMRPA